ncbi:hypothetical protein IH992_33055 [Candidatus Poribacteria bacterium]|nr:hypothetical protein [Candidatus Poribacteria bacterium]
MSRGSHAPPGGTGKPFTGRSGTGDLMISNREVGEMPNAKAELFIIRDFHVLSSKWVTGERRDTEIGHASFGEGRLEKGQL